MVYEIKSVIYPNPPAVFRFFNGVYYNSIVIPKYTIGHHILHQHTNGSEEIELQIGDQILLDLNQWNGFSAELNLRTINRRFFPTF